MSTTETKTEITQVSGRVPPSLKDRYKIALIKNGHTSDFAIEQLIREYIKNGLPGDKHV